MEYTIKPRGNRRKHSVKRDGQTIIAYLMCKNSTRMLELRITSAELTALETKGGEQSKLAANIIRAKLRR